MALCGACRHVGLKAVHGARVVSPSGKHEITLLLVRTVRLITYLLYLWIKIELEDFNSNKLLF